MWSNAAKSTTLLYGGNSDLSLRVTYDSKFDEVFLSSSPEITIGNASADNPYDVPSQIVNKSKVFAYHDVEIGCTIEKYRTNMTTIFTGGKHIEPTRPLRYSVIEPEKYFQYNCIQAKWRPPTNEVFIELEYHLRMRYKRNFGIIKRSRSREYVYGLIKWDTDLNPPQYVVGEGNIALFCNCYIIPVRCTKDRDKNLCLANLTGTSVNDRNGVTGIVDKESPAR